MNRNQLPFIGGPSDQYRPAEIPESWSWTALATIARLESGHTPDRKEAGYWGGEIKWVSLQDTTRLEAPFIYDTAFNVTEAGIANSSARVLPSGTVIFSRTATVGRSTILGSDMATSQDFANYICGKQLYNVYLMHAFRGMSRTWNSLMAGSTHNTIYMPDFKKLRILLPPLPEQKKIAAILSEWDRAIELTEKLIAAKQQRKAALMQQLLTGTVRFSQFVKSSARHHTPVGEMPTDWIEYKLASVATKVKRKNTGGEVHVLTASGEHGLVDQREFFNRSVAGADLSGYYLLKRGEFAYNRSAMNGYPFGAIKRLDRYDQGVLSTLYICFGLSDSGVCDSDFMAHYFEARLLDRQLGEVTQIGGRAHGLLNITDSAFYSMQVVLPGIEEQRRIAPVLNNADSEIDLLRRKLDALRRQKKGLMQQLLTGKVRVRVEGE